MPFTWNQFAERLVWTFIAAAGGALVAPALFGFDMTTLEAAAIAGCGAVVNAVTQFARWRLSVLPNPGDGLVKPDAERPDHADHNDPAAFHDGRDVL